MHVTRWTAILGLLIVMVLSSCAERAKPSPAAPDNLRYEVFYVSPLGGKINAVKKVMEVTGWGLAKAKEFVDNPHQVLKADLSQAEAKELADDLMKSNVAVIVRPQAAGHNTRIESDAAGQGDGGDE